MSGFRIASIVCAIIAIVALVGQAIAKMLITDEENAGRVRTELLTVACFCLPLVATFQILALS